MTTFDLDEPMYAALRAGASGFLLKDVRPNELAEAIRVFAGGEALLAPTVTRRLVVTEATVKTHASAILRKLNVPDRVHAVVAAYDLGLVRPHLSA